MKIVKLLLIFLVIIPIVSAVDVRIENNVLIVNGQEYSNSIDIYKEGEQIATRSIRLQGCEGDNICRGETRTSLTGLNYDNSYYFFVYNNIKGIREKFYFGFSGSSGYIGKGWYESCSLSEECASGNCVGPEYHCCPIDKECFYNNKCYDIGEFTSNGEYVCSDLNTFQTCNDYCNSLGMKCVNGECVGEETKKVKCDLGCADLNGDGIVNDEDIDLFGKKYAYSFIGDSKYDSIADFDGDGSINQKEVNCLGLFYGKNLDCNKVSLSIATLKDVYNVNEEIKITDPPNGLNFDDNKIIDYIVNEDVIDNSLIDYKRELIIEGINKKRSINIGYIIQFKEKSVLEKKIEIEKSAKENEESFLSPAYKLATNVLPTSLEPTLNSNIEKKIGDYKIELSKDLEKNKEKILKKLTKNNKITGRAVGTNKNQIEILSEFIDVFNGIALDISEEEAKEIEKISGVKKIYPNYIIYSALMDSVPLISADKVWNLGYTGKGIKVAVLDTGIDKNHPDLLGKITLENDFVLSSFIDNEKEMGDGDDDNIAQDHDGHGTHVAGIIAANGQIKGVAPDVQLYAGKVLGPNGAPESWIIQGIEWALNPDGNLLTDDGANIISMSLGGPGDPDDAISQAVNLAVDSGAVVVIAAGNNGPIYSTIDSPGVAKKAITVGASDKSNSFAAYSSRGPMLLTAKQMSDRENYEITKPNIMAPGSDIYSSVPGGKYDTKSGTSMAAPHISGAVALLKQAHPDWIPDDIKSALMNTPLDLDYNPYIQGTGRVDILKALNTKFIVNPATINFGYVDLDSNLWRKDISMEIKNLDPNPITYAISIDMEKKQGIEASTSKQIITISPGGTASFDFNVIVDNSIAKFNENVPDEKSRRIVDEFVDYHGKIIIASPLQTIKIPFNFFKKKIDFEVVKSTKDNSFEIIVVPPIKIVSSPTATITNPSGITSKIIKFIQEEENSLRWYGWFNPTETGLHTISVSSDELKESTVFKEINIDITPPNIYIGLTGTQDGSIKIDVSSNEEFSSKFFYPRMVNLDNLKKEGWYNPYMSSIFSNNNKYYLFFQMIKDTPEMGKIVMIKSTNYGVSWEEPKILELGETNDVLRYSYTNPFYYYLEENNNKLYLFITTTTGDIRSFCVSMNDGDSWDCNTIKTPTLPKNSESKFTAFKNKLYVFFKCNENEYDQFRDICFKTSDDDGSIWSNSKKIETGHIYPYIFHFELKHDDYIHIIYSTSEKEWPEISNLKDTKWKLMYIKSLDGTNWEGSEICNYLDLTTLSIIDLDINEDFVHVTFTDFDKDIYYVKSKNDGNSWGTCRKVGNEGFYFFSPIVVNNKKVSIVLQDTLKEGMLGGDIQYILSNNNGDSWSEKQNLRELYFSWYPKTVLDESGQFIIWQESFGMGYQWDLLYTKDTKIDTMITQPDTIEIYLPMTCSEKECYGKFKPIQKGEYVLNVKAYDINSNMGEKTIKFNFPIEFTRPQSKIFNNGNKIIYGNLSIYIQKYKNNKWVDYSNPFKNIQLSVKPNEVVKLDQIFNSKIFNPKGIKINEVGKYRLYTIYEYEENKAEANWEFEVK